VTSDERDGQVSQAEWQRVAGLGVRQGDATLLLQLQTGAKHVGEFTNNKAGASSHIRKNRQLANQVCPASLPPITSETWTGRGRLDLLLSATSHASRPVLFSVLPVACSFFPTCPLLQC
jgi:hypothetical protein